MPADFKLPLVRRPLPSTVDLTDPAAVRVWMTQLVSGELATNGDVQPRLRLVCAQHLEEAPLTHLPDEPGWGAALWHQLTEREDVLRSFRIGVLRLPHEGRLRRCACIVELVDAAEERWWFAFWVLPEVLERGSEVSWLGKEGRGFDTLPPHLQAWVETRGKKIGIDARPPPPTAGPKLLVHFAELSVEAPTSLVSLARFTDRLVRDPELLGLATSHPPIVLILRGRTMERWQTSGALPCGLDDLTRNLCRLGEPPDGVVVLDRAVLDGADALRVSVERAGERLTRTLLLGNPPAWRNPVRAQLGAQAWIGVEPEVDLGLQADGAPGLSAHPDFH